MSQTPEALLRMLIYDIRYNNNVYNLIYNLHSWLYAFFSSVNLNMSNMWNKLGKIRRVKPNWARPAITLLPYHDHRRLHPPPPITMLPTLGLICALATTILCIMNNTHVKNCWCTEHILFKDCWEKFYYHCF